MPRARLVVMCGLPGSGKTTRARELEQSLDAVRFTPDEWMSALGVDLFDEQFRARLEAVLWQLAQRLLLGGRSVVVDFGSWAREERAVFLDCGRRHAVPVELLVLELPVEELVRRVEARTEEGTVPLTRAHVEGYLAHWQPATATERAGVDPPS